MEKVINPELDVKFLVMGTSRTGSNLLISMLNSHPDCYCGFEVFSAESIVENYIPWYLDQIPNDEALLKLRLTDEAALLDRLFSLTSEKGYRKIGVKLMYNEGDDHPAAVDYLCRYPGLRVVHIQRKNLLRRLVSMRRAQSTGVWWVARENDDRPNLPSVRLELLECAGDFDFVECKSTEYSDRFAEHPQYSIFYEDLLMDPQATAAKVCAFLDLPQRELVVGARKTGVDSLRDAIENYDELKQHLHKWISFFEE